MEIEKNCALCGAFFIAKSNKAKYCSKKCHDITYRLNNGIKVNSKPEPFHKICKVCGNSFDTRREAQITCSHECAEKWKGERKVPVSKKCVICKKQFETSWNNHKTCGAEECKKECKKIAYKNRHAQAKANKIKIPRAIIYEMRPCEECGELFVCDSVMKNKYCSEICRKRVRNRKNDKRIPKSQRVDRISLKRLYKRDSGICYLCGGLCDWNSKNKSLKGNEYPGDLYPTIEHVIPICDGGLDSWGNVRLAHWKCNLNKADGKVDVNPMTHEFAISQKPRPNARRTAQYTLDGELIKIWESTGVIERELGLNSKHIQNVCRGENSNTGNAYGYHWEYIT